MSKTIVVIGGGASGLMAAICAARHGASVIVLEQNGRFGKKLLSTGNGKCNLTNTKEYPGCYRSSDPAFPMLVISAFDVQQTIRFFTEIGIYTKNKDGYVYPHSEQATSVTEVLEMEARYQKVKLKTRESVQKIRPSEDGFCVVTETWEYPCDAVILACGSKASVIEGADGKGYELAKELGHTVIKPLPALVGIRGKDNFYGMWAGVRTQAKLSLEIEGLVLKQETGEVQFTDYGLSGIPVFQLSRYVARALDEGCHVSLLLDFFPEFTEEALLAYLKNRMAQTPYKSMKESLIGMIPSKLIDVFTKDASTMDEVAKQMKGFVVPVKDTLSCDHGQVCSGGVDCEEINPMTMESKKVSGLYFCGELVDVDGACGGYNLQWAWSSGAVAGISAAKEQS